VGGVRVSILIVCYRHVDLLGDCLESLRHAVSDAVTSETIVLFNGTGEAERERVRPALGSARVITSPVNLGFGGGNNRAAGGARGEYLVMLNDDTEVRPGWLDSLVETADRYPDAGAVGSRILHPDGTLQEAGSVIWSDGSTLGVGRGLPENSSSYMYLREVDYSSACSLLVRRATFERLGGFDERYFPGYNEDADLCLGIRRLGQRVLYQPRSVVVHHESQTGGEAKEFLILRSRGLLREKWPEELARQAEPRPWDRIAVELAVHRARRSPRRVLIVDSRLPDPGLGSGYGRMLDMVLELADAGYALSLHPTDTAEGDRCALQDLGVDIVENDLVAHLRPPPCLYDAAIVSRPHNFTSSIRALRRFQPQAVVIYDAEALFHRRLERQAELVTESDPVAGDLMLFEAETMRRIEQRIVPAADRVVSVSEGEADFLRSVRGAPAVDVLAPFDPEIQMTQSPFTRRSGMLLVAGWLPPYPSPNSDGLEWFVECVLPAVKQAIPWTRLSVTGAQPNEQLLGLESPWVRFVGHVDDLRAVYDQTRVVVVPMRFGAGVKRKVTEALQHGVPVVTTSVGAEGISGAGGPALSVCDEPAEFAGRVVTLLEDRQSWHAARAAAESWNVSWSTDRTRSWAEIVETALQEKTVDRLALQR
jgi:GT2 family glycosyltransferase/glycosyltransferase involved in cell wall biosynthesis